MTARSEVEGRYSSPYVKEFPFNREALSPEEREYVPFLRDAARGTGLIYLQQIQQGFYPKDASDKEILVAAEADPKILDPYTIVRRDDGGKLIAVSNHVVHQALWVPVVQKLREASPKISHPEMREYVELLTEDLTIGDYETSEAYRLTHPSLPHVTVMGYFDRYLDRRFNQKYAAQSWDGKPNVQASQDLQKLVRMAFGREASQKIRVEVLDTTLFAGMAAERGWSGNSLPCQAERREKYGSVFNIFTQSFEEKFHSQRLPEIREHIAPRLQGHRTEDQLRQGALHFLALHESNHSLARRKGDEARLGRAYTILTEMFCDVGALTATFTLPEDYLPDDEKQDILMGFLGWSIADAHPGKPKPTEKAYVLSDSMVVNFLIDRSQAMKIDDQGRLYWDDNKKLIDELKRLGHRVDWCLTYDQRGEAERMITDYGKPLIGDRFHQNPNSNGNHLENHTPELAA